MDLGIGGLGEATQIGAGGAAIVYRARQTSLGRDVAVKVLTNVDDDFVRRFQREAKTLGKLSQNPGIVTVYDTGNTSTGQPYLVLELCQSSLLDKIRSDGKLDPLKACSILTDVAEAVADAHDLGVVHRDIKPANMLLSPGGRYLITDFGIASVSGSSAGETSAVGFTAAYAAPETFQENGSGPSTDVYSIGATLFHLLAGYPPFVTAGEERNLLAVLHRVVTEPVPDLRPLGVPSLICDLIESTMAKDAEDRPSVRDLADLLAQASWNEVVASLMIDGTPKTDGPDETQPISELHNNARANQTDVNDTVSVGSTEIRPSIPPSVTSSTSPDQSSEIPNPLGPDRKQANKELLPASRNPTVDNQRLLSYSEQPYLSTKPADNTERGIWFLTAAAFVLVVLAAGFIIFIMSRGSSEIAADSGEITQTEENLHASTDSVGNGSGAVPEFPDDLKNRSSSDSLKMPDLDGLTEEQAVAKLDDIDVDYVITYRSSDAVSRGDVIRTTPEANKLLPVDSKVFVFISTGKKTTAVFDVVGMTEREATEQLAEAGFDVEIVRRASATTSKGFVTAADPEPEGLIGAGSTITLTISTGTPCSGQVLPRFSGTEAAAATATLVDAGLVPTAVEQLNETIAAGEVISSTPPAGECVEDGTSVSLAVSCSSKPIPDTEGMTSDDLAVITDAGFTTTINEVENAGLPAGSIVNTVPVADAAACLGTDVVVVVTKATCVTSLPPHANRLVVPFQLLLTSLDLEATVTEAPSEQIEVGRVIATTPAAGTLLCPGDNVAVTVSTGPVCEVLPVLAGRTEAKVTETLEALGFEVTTTRVFNIANAQNIVISSVPKAGAEVCQPAAVALSISKGAPIVVPATVTTLEATAVATLTKLGLVPSVTYVEVPATSALDGLVTTQSLTPASKQEAGTPIALTVAQAAVVPAVPDP